MPYWGKNRLCGKSIAAAKDAIRHTSSDAMEVLEVDSPKEVTIIAMNQIKYVVCDAPVGTVKKPS